MSSLPECLRGRGIECFASTHRFGFTGRIKSHPEDFVVTEIDSEGRLVVLDDFTPPPTPPTPQRPRAGPFGGRREPKRPDVAKVPPLDQLISQEHYQTVSDLAKRFEEDPYLEENVCFGAIEEKGKRANIHLAVSMAFPELKTQSVKNSEGISELYVMPDMKTNQLKVLLGDRAVAKRFQLFTHISNERDCFFLSIDPTPENLTRIDNALLDLYGLTFFARVEPDGSGERKLAVIKSCNKASDSFIRERSLYTKFVMQKTNVESLVALKKLSNAVDCRVSKFAISGIKDKKAVTTQLVSVLGVSAKRLHEACASDPNCYDIKLGNYEYTDRSITTGEHRGNHFRLVLRNVTKKKKMPLVALGEGEGEGEESLDAVVSQAIESVRESGFINYYGPQRFGHGSGLMVGLNMFKRNYMEAIRIILCRVDELSDANERKAKEYFSSTHDAAGMARMLHPRRFKEHAILEALSKHGFNEFGCKKAFFSLPRDSWQMYMNSFSSLLWNHLASYRVKEFGLTPTKGDLVFRTPTPLFQSRENIHQLTEEDVASGRYSISDVVLPHPGRIPVLPGNRVATRCLELLAAVGLPVAMLRSNILRLNLKQPVFRSLLAHPKQLSWRWLTHQQASSNRSIDISKLRLAPVNTGSAINGDATGTCPATPVEEDHKRLELSFSLKPSSYATVLLREIMKSAAL